MSSFSEFGSLVKNRHKPKDKPTDTKVALGFLAPWLIGAICLVVPELLRTLVFARPCGGDQFAAGTVSPSLDMSR